MVRLKVVNRAGHIRYWEWVTSSLGVLYLLGRCATHGEYRESLAGEAAAQANSKASFLKPSNLRWVPRSFSTSAGLWVEYLDNLYLSHPCKKGDLIFSTHLDLSTYFPVGHFNRFSARVSLAYYHYLKNSELNSGLPIVNPDSELLFYIYSGNVSIRLSERFSYQERPFHEYESVFYNVYHTDRFRRFHNVVGPSIVWDQNDLNVQVEYKHESLFSNGAAYRYIDRESELFHGDALLALSPSLSAGMEANGSLHNYSHGDWNDHWRAGAGPALRWRVSKNIRLQLGGGYQAIELASESAPVAEPISLDTFYAYGAVDHTLTPFIRHNVSVAHDSQVGINAANLEGTHLRHALSWVARRDLILRPYWRTSFYRESYGSPGPAYYESFTYTAAGVHIACILKENVQAELNWDYRWKESDVEEWGYQQNRFALAFTFSF